MLNKLKINTTVSLMAGMFSIILFSVTAYSVYSSVTTNGNFKQVLLVAENNDMIRDTANDLNAAVASANGMMMQAALGKSFSDEMAKSTSELLKATPQRMATFMKTPFSSKEEEKAAEEVKKAFDEVYAEASVRINYLQNPGDYKGSIVGGMEQRLALSKKIDNYISIAQKQSQNYTLAADRDYKRMITFGIAVIALSVVMMVAVRYWLRHALVNRMDKTIHMLKLVAAGDLSQSIDTDGENEISNMMQELEKMRASLTGTIQGIRESVLHIHSNSQEIARGNSDLSSRTEEQAAALQQTAASM